MGTIIIIEDLQPGKSGSGIEDHHINFNREMYRIHCKSLERKPRDPYVWSKFISDKKALKLAKSKHRAEMISKYSNYTNKSDFYTQKALIWS